jgi:hypothetical protein
MIFSRPCGARLRGKSGARCRAPALKGHARCRIHAGRPEASGSPEGRAATKAGHAAYYAKRKAAIARGEAAGFYRRKRKWIIARPWRFASLSQADETAVVRQRLDMLMRGADRDRPPWQSHASASMEAQACESLSRTFIAKLNDRSAGLSLEQVERTYETIVAAELAIGGEGSEIRKHRLTWERQQWILRASLPTVIERIAHTCEKAAEHAWPPGPAPLQSPGEMRLENQKTGQNNQAAGERSPPLPASSFEPCEAGPPRGREVEDDPVETAQQRRERRLQAFYEISMTAVAAGQGRGRRLRELEDAAAARVPRSASERVHPVRSIAPWLYQR